MAIASRAEPRYTYEQYVGIEQVSNTKHEFYDGKIYAMAGGTEDHSSIQTTVVATLVNALGGRGKCRVHGSDMRTYVEIAGMAAFPDCSVIRGAFEQHAKSPNATALNPSVLVEVTSESSEEYDRTVKLEAYQTIQTLREYVIVSHRERRVTVYTRGERGWISRVAIGGSKIAVESIGVEIVVDTLYQDTSIR